MKRFNESVSTDREKIKNSIMAVFLMVIILTSIGAASIGAVRSEEVTSEEFELNEIQEEISELESEEAESRSLNRDFEMKEKEGLDFMIEADISSDVLSSLNDEDDLSQVLRSSDAGEGEVGTPELPVYREWIMIPEGNSLEIEISEGESLEYEDVEIPPVQPPRPAVDHSSEMFDEDRYEPEFTKDEEIYNTDEDFPGYLVDTEDQGSTDGLEYMIIEKYPYQYNPVQETLSAYPELSITVNFEEEIQQTSFQLKNSNIDEIRERLAINSESVLEAKAEAGDESIMTYMDEKEQFMVYDDNDILSAAGGGTEGAAEFLIIAPPEFEDAAEDLADWRDQTGIPTHVATTEETGETADEITSYIEDAYNDWDPSPEYLLLFGDAEYIPPHYETESSYDNEKIGTDVYYATMEESESEYFPDLSHGRMTVETEDQAQSRVDEIIKYEKDPVDSTSFYEGSTHAAQFQCGGDGYADRRFTQTSEDIAIFLEDNEYLGEYSADRIYEYTGDHEPEYWGNDAYFDGGPAGDRGDPIPDHLSEDWNGDREIWDGEADEISSAVNDGTFLLTHRNHGSPYGWGTPSYRYNDVEDLTNEDKLPVVWSMNCLTGYFDHETADDASHDHAFVEAWEQNQEGGAAGVIASTRVSYSDHNDRLTWGLTDAIWPEFLDYSY